MYLVSARYNKEINGVDLIFLDKGKLRTISFHHDEFPPYFLSKEKIGNCVKIYKRNLLTNTIEPFYKILCSTPDSVKKLSKGKNDVWENKIKYHQNFLFDKQLIVGMNYEGKPLKLKLDEKIEERIKSLQEILKVGFSDETFVTEMLRVFEYPLPEFEFVAFDIECYNEKYRIPNPEDADSPIISIALWNSHNQKTCLLLDQPNKEKTFTDISPDIKIIFFKDEKMLIERFVSMLEQYPFSFSFNGDNFDLYYILQRAKNLGLDLKDKIIYTKNGMLLKNSIHIDLFKVLSVKALQTYIYKEKYKNVSLDEVGQALLGIAKKRFPQERLAEIIKNGTRVLTYQELVEYNMRDAEITFKIVTLDDCLIIKILWGLARISRMTLEDVSRGKISQWIRNALYYEHRKNGFLIPNPQTLLKKGEAKSKAISKDKKYRGAVVIPPKSGLFFGVDVMDFQSLYPSIIKNFNIGYETINCGHPECLNNIPTEETGHHICTKVTALGSKFIGLLKDMRVQWYKKKSKDKSLSANEKHWYEAVEGLIKVFTNASYGVFGNENFDFYCPLVSEEITAIGRKSILETYNKCQELGLNVIYGDTDSLFVEKNDKIGEVRKFAEEQFGLDLGLDKSYKFCIFSERKKNYLGVTQNGDIDIKGLTGKKKHVPLIIKNAFEETKKVFLKIESREDLEAVKKEIAEILRKTYNKLKQRKWSSLEELSFKMRLNKRLADYNAKGKPQHVSVAEQMRYDLGMDMEGGEQIEFVKVVGKVSAKPLSLVKNEEVDVEKYISFLKNTFQQVLETLDLNFDEIVLNTVKLDSWI